MAITPADNPANESPVNAENAPVTFAAPEVIPSKLAPMAFSAAEALSSAVMTIFVLLSLATALVFPYRQKLHHKALNVIDAEQFGNDIQRLPIQAAHHCPGGNRYSGVVRYRPWCEWRLMRLTPGGQFFALASMPARCAA
jgi:hypothetical protein